MNTQRTAQRTTGKIAPGAPDDVFVKGNPGESCINPDMSLLELYHKRRLLSNKLSLVPTPADRTAVYDQIDVVNAAIRKVETAMSTPGVQVRLM
jgi:hypothetical protein